MTDFGIDFRSSDDFPHLRDRVAAARAQFRANAEQYVQLRRRAEAMRKEAQELRDHATELRDSLRDSVATYVAVLRQIDMPPERAIVLVKSAVLESDLFPDKHHRQVIEEAVLAGEDVVATTQLVGDVQPDAAGLVIPVAQQGPQRDEIDMVVTVLVTDGDGRQRRRIPPPEAVACQRSCPRRHNAGTEIDEVSPP